MLQPLEHNIKQEEEEDEKKEEEEYEGGDEEQYEGEDEKQDKEEEEEEEEDDVMDILEELDARDKRIEILKEILLYAKESLKYKEPISDQLKGSLKEYEDFAFMNFEEEYGEGIMDDKKGIVEAVEAQLIDEIKERHTISEGTYENYETLDTLSSKDYDSEKSDASTIKPSKSISSENSAKDSNSNDSNSNCPAKSSLVDDFADVSQVMQD
jgi:hypothetical protein